MNRHLIFRKICETPTKTFIASAYRVTDEFGSRYETELVQRSSHETATRLDAEQEVWNLINAAKASYLDSSGDE